MGSSKSKTESTQYVHSYSTSFPQSRGYVYESPPNSFTPSAPRWNDVEVDSRTRAGTSYLNTEVLYRTSAVSPQTSLHRGASYSLRKEETTHVQRTNPDTSGGHYSSSVQAKPVSAHQRKPLRVALPNADPPSITRQRTSPDTSGGRYSSSVQSSSVPSQPSNPVGRTPLIADPPSITRQRINPGFSDARTPSVNAKPVPAQPSNPFRDPLLDTGVPSITLQSILQKREKELQEEEDFQLALALSKSEAEHKAQGTSSDTSGVWYSSSVRASSVPSQSSKSVGRTPLIADPPSITQQNSGSSSSKSGVGSNIYSQIPTCLQEETKPLKATNTDKKTGNKDSKKNQGDCKFYYYAHCRRGDKCSYRHEPASRYSSVVCNLWLQRKCDREHCIFRHMHLENNTTPCYWETKMADGCRIENCPFQHSKSEGVGDAANKNISTAVRQENKPKPSGDIPTLWQWSPKPDQLGSNSNLLQYGVVEEASWNISETPEADSQHRHRNANKRFQDCRFYYYDTCTRAKCLYRHDPTALGSTEVCFDWRVGKCHRSSCKFRHMVVKNNPESCWWEKNSPTGCQIKDCPYKHNLKKPGEEKDMAAGTTYSSNTTAKQEGKRPRKNRRRGRKNGPRNSSGDADIPEEGHEEAASASTDSENVAAKVHELEKQLQETKKKLEERDKAVKNAKMEQVKLTKAKVEEVKKDLQKKLEEGFTCSICMELFISAVTLHCSHTFCQYCIATWRKYNLYCPSCRKPISSETRALNIDNYIDETITSMSHEVQLRRAEAVRQRQDDKM